MLGRGCPCGGCGWRLAPARPAGGREDAALASAPPLLLPFPSALHNRLRKMSVKTSHCSLSENIQQKARGDHRVQFSFPWCLHIALVIKGNNRRKRNHVDRKVRGHELEAPGTRLSQSPHGGYHRVGSLQLKQQGWGSATTASLVGSGGTPLTGGAREQVRLSRDWGATG